MSDNDEIDVVPLTDFLTEATILTKPTMDIFLQQENSAELIALYSFYYYTSKWQKTNIPKATISYVGKGLGWGEDKVRKYKKKLMELGLIESIVRKEEDGKISGWYIRVCFVVSKKALESTKYHSGYLPEGGLIQKVEFTHPNALSTNSLNSLSTNSKEEPINLFEQTDKQNEEQKETTDGVSGNSDIFSQVHARWNVFAKANGLSTLQEMTAKRKKHLKARMAEKSFKLEDILFKIEGSPFLKGKNDRGWRVTFDFITEKSDGYIKILEGKYDSVKNNFTNTSINKSPGGYNGEPVDFRKPS